MNETGLRMAICGLLGWSRMADRRKRQRLQRLKRSMRDNQRIAPKKYTIEIKVD